MHPKLHKTCKQSQPKNTAIPSGANTKRFHGGDPICERENQTLATRFNPEASLHGNSSNPFLLTHTSMHCKLS